MLVSILAMLSNLKSDSTGGMGRRGGGDGGRGGVQTQAPYILRIHEPTNVTGIVVLGASVHRELPFSRSTGQCLQSIQQWVTELIVRYPKGSACSDVTWHMVTTGKRQGHPRGMRLVTCTDGI
jgi:hypothetical protein